jgi:hypothetical protein
LECFKQRKKSEMDNAFELLGKYVEPKDKDEELVLVNTGGNNYVLGIREKGSGAYSTLGSHLSKRQMTDTLWDMTKILGELQYGNLKMKGEA